MKALVSTLIIVLFYSPTIFAQDLSKKVLPKATALSLEAYLEQVKAGSPNARSLVDSVKQAELRLDEAEVSLSSELYGAYKLFDDKNEPPNPFSPPRTKALSWRAGIRDRNSLGTSMDLYFDSNHTSFLGANPQFLPLDDFYDSRLGLDIRQPLWRNSFGTATRAELDAQRAQSRLSYLQAKFQLKNLLTSAENTYWSLVSYGQVVQLQQESVDRAKKLRDWMKGRAGLRLVDDVDALQAQASLEMRELELQESLDVQAGLRRLFNTLRGQTNDEVGPLAELPTGEFLLRMAKDPNRRMTREDFGMLYESAKINAATGRAARSRIAPELDLVASVAANGLDRSLSESYGETTAFDHPTVAIGVTFSIPLDYSLIHNMRDSYRAQERAAVAQKANAEFAEQRAWDDLLKQKIEAQVRFERASALEEIQTKLVKRERQRLLNGRTTTFQAITFEQNLALAQIQKVRSQLALLQLHNMLKQFEAKL